MADIKPTSPTCELEFYFYMLGYTDDIRVYMLTGAESTLLLKLSQDNGNRWNKATIKLGRISRSFQLEFEGSGYSWATSDVALDDISLKACSYPPPSATCPFNYFTCKNKVCVDKKSVCDLTDDCGDGSDEEVCDKYSLCDFENGLCEWSHDKDADFEWDVKEGFYTWNPTRDHTTGTPFGN